VVFNPSRYEATAHSVLRLEKRFIREYEWRKVTNREPDLLRIMERDGIKSRETAIQRFLEEAAQQGRVLIDYRQHRYIIYEDMLLSCVKRGFVFKIKTVMVWDKQREQSMQLLINAIDRILHH